MLTSSEAAHRLGYVLVTPGGPHDGGDFGPYTPGTHTAGIQEALERACAQHRNLFIAGDQSAGPYRTEATIHVPPRQGFRIDGGPYVLSFEGSGDALCIDSCMDCWYRFGLITSRGDGAVVRLAPRTPVPIDGMTVLTDSVFEFSSLVGGGRFDLNLKRVVQAPRGTGILLDATQGAIVYNRIFAVAVLLCETGVGFDTGASGAVSNNWIHVLHNHQNAVGLRMGTEDARPGAVALNRLDMSLNAEDVPDAVGAVVAGRANVLTLDSVRMAANRDVVFTPGARGNVVHALSAPSGVTDLAGPAANRLAGPTAMGFACQTPDVPTSGASAVNRWPGPVEAIILDAGDVRAWTIVDPAGHAQRVQAGLRPGERFLLEPGAGLGFEFSAPPTWRWRALP